MAPSSYILWGSRLSPFLLKVEAMCRYAGVDFRLLPAGGGAIENARIDRRIRRLKAGRLPLTYPERTDLDELPLVPYLFGSGGENLYDSSAIAEWLDRHHLEGERRLLPDQPAARFAARLIDEYFDEMGLYMAHHNRWVTSAATNDAGKRLAREFRSFVPPPLGPLLAERFSARQVRRLPYLFSVAPPGFVVEGLRARRQPPSREGFPPTHALLDTAFARMLERVELLLCDRPFLLGGRFTVADASAYGQLAMNTHDGAASELIEKRAPLTYAWLQRIERGEIDSPARATGGELELGPRLNPLLEEIGRTFIALMKQNEAAYERERTAGTTRFNEAAFDRGEALYDGEIDRTPFRGVVKTFQVKVWRRLQSEWYELDATERAPLEAVMS